MKKIFALLLAFVMVFSLAACGDKNPDKPAKNHNSVNNNNFFCQPHLFQSVCHEGHLPEIICCDTAVSITY